ncbi:MAG: ELM1/GtrOC1 family putative glycosyltransferase [Pseudomonadota bacterium]
MPELTVLIVSDGIAGHVRLAEGICVALGRFLKVDVRILEARRVRRWLPRRGLATLLKFGCFKTVLRAAYSLQLRWIPRSEVIISAGGDTLEANVAIAKALSVPNVFYGTVRRVDPSDLALVLTSYEANTTLNNHSFSIKPSAFDPRAIPLKPAKTFSLTEPPRTLGILIGGDDDRLFRYTNADWRRLFAFVAELSSRHGISCLISTSRRTPARVAEAARRSLESDPHSRNRFIDFAADGGDTIEGLLADADAVLCTADSSNMLSEAICARRPVVALTPETFAYKPAEQAYRNYLVESGWCQQLALRDLDMCAFIRTLGKIVPRRDCVHDELAELLRARLVLNAAEL